MVGHRYRINTHRFIRKNWTRFFCHQNGDKNQEEWGVHWSKSTNIGISPTWNWELQQQHGDLDKETELKLRVGGCTKNLGIQRSILERSCLNIMWLDLQFLGLCEDYMGHLVLQFTGFGSPDEELTCVRGYHVNVNPFKQFIYIQCQYHPMQLILPHSYDSFSSLT